MAAVREVVSRTLAEDLGPLGDLTSALLESGTLVRAHLVSRSNGVLAGRASATEAFRQVDAAIDVTWTSDDGDLLQPGRSVATVEGHLAAVLTAERTALNLLCHLSGVATLTRRYVDIVAEVSGGRAAVRDTRKTTPGLRALEKAAVRAGGGVNHRGSLSDGVLLKDNHLAGTSIGVAVKEARRRWPGHLVQVECDVSGQVEEALSAGVDLVLLDNMSPNEVRACVAAVAGRCLVEVSGGVTLDTVADYAATGADLISVGAITHSAAIVDIGLDVPPTFFGRQTVVDTVQSPKNDVPDPSDTP